MRRDLSHEVLRTVPLWSLRSRGLATDSGPYDTIVIGGGESPYVKFRAISDEGLGPGGYVAAIKAAQMGLKVGSQSSY